MRAAEANNSNFVISNWFHLIYKSEYCKESRHTLMEDMTFEEFAAFSDEIMYWMDLDRAADIDSKREEHNNKVRPQG